MLVSVKFSLYLTSFQEKQSRRSTSANSHSAGILDIHTADRSGVLCF